MQILILGAGYAGVRLALALARAPGGGDSPLRATLLDQHPYHQHVALLHRTATAAIDEHQAIIPLHQLVRGKVVQVVQGTAARIDPDQQQVMLTDGRSLRYDHLVVAVGVQANQHDVAGAAEHTLALRSFDEARALRDHVVRCVAEAAACHNPARRRVLLTVAVVGGGFIGCQLAGELADWLPDLAHDSGLPPDDTRVALLERGSALLTNFGSWASRQARTVLDRQRVSIYLEAAVEAVHHECLIVSEQRMLPAATIVWATSTRTPPLLAQSGLPLDERGRLPVDRFLRVEGVPNVSAAGDCARIIDPFDQTVLPATASYAMRQGDYLAAALRDDLEGRARRAYTPLRLGHLVSLGPGQAVGNPLGVPIGGRLAARLKDEVEQWYLTTLRHMAQPAHEQGSNDHQGA